MMGITTTTIHFKSTTSWHRLIHEEYCLTALGPLFSVTIHD
jgi:hypothetical protein